MRVKHRPAVILWLKEPTQSEIVFVKESCYSVGNQSHRYLQHCVFAAARMDSGPLNFPHPPTLFWIWGLVTLRRGRDRAERKEMARRLLFPNGWRLDTDLSCLLLERQSRKNLAEYKREQAKDEVYSQMLSHVARKWTGHSRPRPNLAIHCSLPPAQDATVGDCRLPHTGPPEARPCS